MSTNYSFPFNPMMNAQQRLNQLEAQYPQFAQQNFQQPIQQFQPQGFKVIPVTNIEEANATQVDVQGTPTFFYNQAKNEVYLKRINLNTGLADFLKFGLIQEPILNDNDNLNINTYKEDFKLLNDKLDVLLNNFGKDINIPTKNVEKGGKNAK